ncbi:TPA: hypothetical protein MW255_001057 [Acinetobacter baumannii]|nr:hypothetical protein [Acinetobacter baumannii]
MVQQVDIHVEEMQPNSSIIGIKNVYKHKAPPKGHPNGIFCPNCDAWTWRTARECVECPFDLWLHFDRVEKERRKEILKKRAMNFMIAAAICFAIGYCLINFFSMSYGVGLIVIAFIIFKVGIDIEQAA